MEFVSRTDNFNLPVGMNPQRCVGEIAFCQHFDFAGGMGEGIGQRTKATLLHEGVDLAALEMSVGVEVGFD